MCFGRNTETAKGCCYRRRFQLLIQITLIVADADEIAEILKIMFQINLDAGPLDIFQESIRKFLEKFF